MKLKRIFISVISIITLFCFFTTNVFADVNLGNGDGTEFAEGNSNNFWGLKKKDGSKLHELEGLRVTVYSTEDNSKVASTFDISGSNSVNSVDEIIHFTNSSGELVSKTEWLEYVGGTYNALDQNSISKFNNAVFNRYDTYSDYDYEVVSELNSIDIISANNTQNLEKIRKLLGKPEFVTRMCELIGGGITYEDFQKGKYKIAFEPVAYFCYGGYNFAMTATECALYDKFLKNTMPSDWFGKNGLVYQVGNLTHSNLPRSAFLEDEDLNIAPYVGGNRSDYYFAGTTAYNSNNCIIRSMGIGVVSAGEPPEEEEIEGTTTTAEYHTDVYVYTSFTFLNNGDDMISEDATFSIYNSNGETPKMYWTESGGLRRKDPSSSVTVYVDHPNLSNPDWNGYGPYYKRLGTYSDGERIRVDDVGGNEFSYVVRKENGSTIANGDLSFACPSGDNGMAWFKWKTPKTAQNVTISIYSNESRVYIIDSDGNACSSVTINARIDKVEEKTPPDPKATDIKPSWFSLKDESTVEDTAAQYAPVYGEQELSWYVWECTYHPSTYQDWKSNESGTRETWGVYYEYYASPNAAEKDRPTKVNVDYAVYLGGCTFTKREYSVSLSADITVKPSERCPTATYSNSTDTYTMKSGYGFEIEVDVHLRGNTTYCTGSQKANVLFPEFNYSTQNGYKYNRLLEKASGTFVFKKNEFSTYNDRVHFTPIWYPDDEYVVYAEVFDVWCPAGQLSVRLTDVINIDGNVYDDWHVAPDKP